MKLDVTIKATITLVKDLEYNLIIDGQAFKVKMPKGTCFLTAYWNGADIFGGWSVSARSLNLSSSSLLVTDLYGEVEEVYGMDQLFSIPKDAVYAEMLQVVAGDKEKAYRVPTS